MLTTTKRAEAVTSTLILSRLAGRSDINPMRMEVTMVTTITPGAVPAIPERDCPICGTTFTPLKATRVTCSSRCHEAHYRARLAGDAKPALAERVLPVAGTTLADHSGIDVPATEHLPHGASSKQKCPPVRQRGKMTPDGWRSENAAWLEELTEPHPTRPGFRIGRDPMTIDVAILAMAGHPPRRTGALVSAKRAAMGDAEDWYAGVRSYSDIPRLVCAPCSDVDDDRQRLNLGPIRRCAVIACPMWAYRLGRNPHNPKRGKLPAHLMTAAKSDAMGPQAEGEAH